MEQRWRAHEFAYADEKRAVFDELIGLARDLGFTDVETNADKPWGGYIRFDNSNIEAFIAEFFPEFESEAIHLGNTTAELSPKLLVVSPGERLSLQRHDRRAELWRFITPGAYHRSLSDDGGEVQYAAAGDTVQFAAGETHRLCGVDDDIVLVAEIWQHTDPDHLSDENDITRLEDDYAR